MKQNRKAILQDVKIQVLTESGYRCAVPTCRYILTLNLHHIERVADEGPDTPDNLIALCANCHHLYHNGTITKDSIYVWKGILISLGRAFDYDTIDCLLLLDGMKERLGPVVSGDLVMKYSKLIASGLVAYEERHYKELSSSRRMTMIDMMDPGRLEGYSLCLTEKGRLLVNAWKSGNQEAIRAAMGYIPQNDHRR